MAVCVRVRLCLAVALAVFARLCRYEEVVADPEAVMRRVLHALGLAWDPAVLNFHASNRTVHTHSQSRK